MIGRLHAFAAALLVFGCASVTAEPPETQTAIRRFYEAHASENIGQCLAPYIDGFTTLRVVDSDPERMVVDARYMYRDWIKDERASDGQRLGNPCVGFGERRFVLAKIDGTWRVEQMSGPQRGRASAPSGNPGLR
jgi:hypothetical protein